MKKLGKIIFFSILSILVLSLFGLVINVKASPGCCSHHGGQSYCSAGSWICADGWKSSCGCYDSDNISFESSSSSSSNSVDSNAQIYFFWIPLGIITLICVIKGIDRKDSDIDKNEYIRFKNLVGDTIEKYENRKCKEISIILDDSIVIDALCFKRGKTIYIVNISRKKEAYRLYRAGFFNENGIFKSENIFKIYDKYGFIYYKYDEIRKKRFILADTFNLEENSFKNKIDINYKTVKIITKNIDTGRKWEFEIDIDSLEEIQEYIAESIVSMKDSDYDNWCR